MKSIELKPLIEKFNEYVEHIGTAEDIAGAKKEFGKLLTSIYSAFNYAKAAKEEIEERIRQHDSFIVICDTVKAAEDEKTYLLEALALTGRANAYRAIGNMGEAARDFRRSADVAAGFKGGESVRISSVVNLANVYSKTMNPDKCIACFSEAVRIASRMEGDDGKFRHMALLADRGNAYCRVGKINEAYEDFTYSLELYGSLGIDDEKTKKVLLKCLANRSGVLVNLRRFDEAREDGLRALELEGETISAITPVALTNLAAACKCLSLFEDADKYFTKVIMIKKVTGGIAKPAGRLDLATLILGRGEVRLMMKNYEDAESDLSQAVELFKDLMEKHEQAVKPRLARALKMRAETNRGLGKEAEAAKDFAESENLTGKALD